ncbi:10163_t:CDS:2 [Acaulospora colombiana]|uniref:10163_t:CDS:1 n=1 Tax=Acaulospora colombiana TaxID=27376 RepID=A0ACA9NIX6_9GLOM|nr:10163_t:CDS:2 [Acaulospora colombiana]
MLTEEGLVWSFEAEGCAPHFEDRDDVIWDTKKLTMRQMRSKNDTSEMAVWHDNNLVRMKLNGRSQGVRAPRTGENMNLILCTSPANQTRGNHLGCQSEYTAADSQFTRTVSMAGDRPSLCTKKNTKPLLLSLRSILGLIMKPKASVRRRLEGRYPPLEPHYQCSKNRSDPNLHGDQYEYSTMVKRIQMGTYLWKFSRMEEGNVVALKSPEIVGKIYSTSCAQTWFNE